MVILLLDHLDSGGAKLDLLVDCELQLYIWIKVILVFIPLSLFTNIFSRKPICDSI